jgi:histidine ammonia-lyase
MSIFTFHNGKEVKTEEIVRVANGGDVHIEDEVYTILDNRRKQIINKIKASNEPAYGFNRGFGHNVDIPVSKDQLANLQENLIRSHACGVGPPASIEIVRATMLLRIISLARGYSGVRSHVIKMLEQMLNKRITPVVPLFGSVGASGDLAPLSHIALAMLGEGDVFFGKTNERIKASEALQKVGVKPIRLEMKEGLALNNGAQYSTAIGILAGAKLMNLLKTAAVISAISTQVMLGSDTPFRADLHALRPHRGAKKVAAWIWELLKDSPIREAHAPYNIDGEIQDPYNIRCAAQILGACYDLIEEARSTFEIEANSVTDNPLILEDEDKNNSFTTIVSGGHFHGMPVAVKLYNLMQSMGIISRLSNTRCVRYVDESKNKGLGRDLKWPELNVEIDATCSGMMIPEYTSASLTNHIWGACMPTHLFSLSTDAGQEDHVSMSAGLAVRVWETIPRLAEVLAIELAMASQAAAIRKTLDYIPSKINLSPKQYEETQQARKNYEKALHQFLGGGNFRIKLDVKLEYFINETQRSLSPACEIVVNEVGKIFPTLKEDRFMADEINKLAMFILDGKIIKIFDPSLTGPVSCL